MCHRGLGCRCIGSSGIVGRCVRNMRSIRVITIVVSGITRIRRIRSIVSVINIRISARIRIRSINRIFVSPQLVFVLSLLLLFVIFSSINVCDNTRIGSIASIRSIRSRMCLCIMMSVLLRL